MIQMTFQTVELPLAKPFAISRGTRTAVTVVRVSLTDGKFTAVGECTPTARYQESPQSVCGQLELIRPQIEQGLSREALQQALPAGSARNALDCAMWRLDAAKQGKDLWQLLDMPKPVSVITAETLSLDLLENMANAAAVAVAGGAQLLKIKLDREQIIEKVAAIRAAAPQATLVVDANEAWSGLDLGSLFQALHELNVAMIEQPLPAGNDNDLVRCLHPVPVCADESCHERGDIEGLRDRYEMINIKLDKCGGLTEALAMTGVARQSGLRIMVGCMLGSSLAMEAALPVAVQAERVDLDGPIWLAQDAEPALRYENGEVWL
ncbi:muconate cycloisomerase [Rahnella aquatilis CIP 78.65 = ATCC 33071]|uniref:Dipeptide epimerase n=1 Tax=Rahnella aquatilis (strain ATCC 33071 / DSM 4594 / JCM 1683 / NBRC 105701 / NCIMB 13365 / CIP 78.65) TaxID=745277 RepID=H2IPA0_RAHAC|nr:N-acetyl-D-Glu racemase DgcA [Rahnella aquatilis]AEX52347.1 enolase superfamily enzyme related to L-alanine-DL-glutamate epimerase [Rahnella aquatilis CIP 78.65 = ATCC 33071]KFD08623.1 muconate cycloisomerase [Rahnella aquatilis CIP 78.65 = ATCC 33071]